MQYDSDELLLKKVCEEMGLPWNDTPGELLISGQTASEYFKDHTIFPTDYFVNVQFEEIILRCFEECANNAVENYCENGNDYRKAA